MDSRKGEKGQENGIGTENAGSLRMPEVRLYSFKEVGSPLLPIAMCTVRFPNDAYIFIGSIRDTMGL